MASSEFLGDTINSCQQADDMLRLDNYLLVGTTTHFAPLSDLSLFNMSDNEHNSSMESTRAGDKTNMSSRSSDVLQIHLDYSQPADRSP